MNRSVAVTIGLTVMLSVAGSAGGRDVNADRGAEVYTAQKCSLCHSIAGKGAKKGALDGVGSKLSAAEIRAWLTDPAGMTAKAKATRKPPMKKKDMPAEDIDALVAYLLTLK
jgi:mono/diheme cytochrome c family protein